MTESTDAEAPQVSTKARPVAKKKRYTFMGILGLFAFGVALIYGIVIYLLHSETFDRIVLIPFKPTEKEYQSGAIADSVKAQEIFFTTSDGSKLHGWYFSRPGDKLTVIFHHGNAANIAYRIYIADYLMKAGISVFLYDYRGYGKSQGTPRVADLTPDGLAAFDYLTKELHVNPHSVVNYGESIGTGVACQVASQRPCAGLILQSTIGSLPLMAHKHFNFVKGIPLLVLVPDFLLPDPKLNNVEQIKQVHAPVIIIHGEKDETAPIEHARMVFASANEPKKFVALPHGSHNDVAEDSKLFTESIENFFATTAAAAPQRK